MYSNIPVNDAIGILKQRLEENASLPPEAINELINLVRVVAKQNYFQFNGKYFIQTEGLAMGSPLSSILAELYLNEFERKYIMNENNKYRQNIIYYFRYADDIICLYRW